MRLWVVIVALVFFSINGYAQSKPSKLAVTEALGDTLLNRQDFDGALKQYNKVAKSTKLKTPDNRAILYKRAICYFYLGEFKKALNDLNVYIPENANFTRARILRAFICRELGETDQQLEDLNIVLENDAMNIDLLKWRAGLMVEMGMNREALAELKAIKVWGTDEEVELYLGLSYYGLEEPDSAIIHFDEAISINGGYLPAYIYAGSVSLEQDAYEMALSYLNLGLMLEPNNLQMIFYKGVALVQTGNKVEGCRLLNKAFYSGVDDAGGYLEEFCFPKEE